MEISETIIKGPNLKIKSCPECNHEDFETRGFIKYGYFILESLPFFLVGKEIEVSCTHCHIVLNDDEVPKELDKSLREKMFPLTKLVSKFLGSFLTLIGLLAFYQFYLYKDAEIDGFIKDPHIHDFLVVDYRKLADTTRPNQNFLMAKIVDITGDIISLSYGNYYFVHQDFAENSIKLGRTNSFGYFNPKRHNFTIEEYARLRQEGAIADVMRPESNMLFGHQVVIPTPLPEANPLIPGSVENIKGLAFLEAVNQEGYLDKAESFLSLSAEKGYSYGQFNLANLILKRSTSSENKLKALELYKQSALQDFQPALDKYLSICDKHDFCDSNKFYAELKQNGVNITYQ